ncbi:MAG: hypothetical protein R3B09_25455 [Nannocystaceae bacterium]
MSLLRRLFRRSRPRQVVDFVDLCGDGLHPGDRIELAGRVEAQGTVVDPIGDLECVAIEYRAWPQPTTIGIDGAPVGARAFHLTCHHAADFVLERHGARIYVRVDRGRDVAAIHGDLVGRYGVGLRSEVRRIVDGDEVRLVGAIERLRGGASPLRDDPYLAVIAAERLWAVG